MKRSQQGGWREGAWRAKGLLYLHDAGTSGAGRSLLPKPFLLTDNVCMGSAQLLEDPRGFGLPEMKCGAGRESSAGRISWCVHPMSCVLPWGGGGM